MRKTTDFKLKNTDKLLVSTENLQAMLDCGRQSAIEIGKLAGARHRIGRRVFWNVQKVKDYLDEM